MNGRSSLARSAPDGRPTAAGVLVDDAVLPAAAHLTGPHARQVLGAALEAVGGRLDGLRA